MKTILPGSRIAMVESDVYIVLVLCSILFFALFAYLIWYLFLRQRNAILLRDLKLVRAGCNPVHSPNEASYWETEGTFNPAAVVDTDGKVHLLYRAIGADGMSRLGYLSSTDGIHFEKPLSYPVYESIQDVAEDAPQSYSPSYYTSGGGWNGCEDPRAVEIDGTVYVTYVAFGGWNSIRMALTSISLEDLRKHRWRWKSSRLISPPGEAHKNWMLFPEKVNGKFAILHCISPEILIEYVDDLDELTYRHIKSRPPHDGKRNYFGRENFWDNSVRSAGPPPIKTKDGWLLLYHSMDKHDPNKYKLGAMLLDLKDPTKILYRSPLPILSPDEHYENNHKPGVIYASGAVVKNKTLYVYYGGGDRHLCVAHTKLATLLRWLKMHGSVH